MLMMGIFDELLYGDELLKSDSSKVMSLREAVSRYIKPGMMIHIGQTNIRWCTAIIYEIARQFWKKNPDFTLVGISMNFPQSILVHGGLVRKIITSYCGDPYYAPSPNSVYQRAFEEGTLEIENWSIYTLPLRLKAAALGLPFLPTFSLVGSDMAKENDGSFLIVDDPFQTGEKVGLVKPLQPDITIIHGLMADKEGNAIFLPPLAENLYGAMASKEGVILTVEKIVPTETIRKYSQFTRLPGYYVRSVSEVPFGAHPSGLSRVGMEDMDLYMEDYEFVEEAHQASKSPEVFENWIKKWVLSCKDHNDYLKRLGYERILKLKGLSHFDSWRFDITAIEDLPKTTNYTPIEMAVVTMARKLTEKVKKNKYLTMLAGAGIANLAAWLSYYMLKKEGYSLDLMAEVGLYGYVPRPTDPAIFNMRNFPTCKMNTDIHTIMGILVGGRKARCIGALGAAQVDEEGNINTTKTASDRYVVGSGGANDVASRAKEIVAILPHVRERLPRKVHYITSPGKNVRTVITTLGSFEKRGTDTKFTLTSYYPKDGLSKEQVIQKISAGSDWSFDVADDLEEVSPPTKWELDLLRAFDPRRFYLGLLPDE
ncbi:MAG TPA: glutaconate CoA-transferase [Deltaproteobacteria bacterium]|nr:glutaconate CoA-transferase [Deltaproteobacteria bacterium]